MNQLHTPEEIKHLDQQVELAHELTKLANKYGNLAIKQEADQILINNRQELDKYKHLIGTTCYAPPSFLSKDKVFRKGIIEEITHFNNYSKSVRVSFRYDRSIGSGFDRHSLKELKEQA